MKCSDLIDISTWQLNFSCVYTVCKDMYDIYTFVNKVYKYKTNIIQLCIQFELIIHGGTGNSYV